MKIECGPDWDRRVINIDTAKENIGISMSGGIDSYVLYYLLCKFTTPKIFNFVRPDGFDQQEQIKKLTGRDDITIIPELNPDPNQRIVAAWDHVIAEYDIDFLYTGMNIIPHTEYFPEFSTTGSGKPTRPWRIEGKLKAPFLHLYKYHIIEIANHFSIDLSKTQSCLTQLKGHCGKCWQCKERQWGFDNVQ